MIPAHATVSLRSDGVWSWRRAGRSAVAHDRAPAVPRPSRLARWCAAAALAVLAACASSESTSPRIASLELRLAPPGGKSATTVIPDSVILTITGYGIASPIVKSVVLDTAGNASVTLSVPIGNNRTLQLDFYKGGLLIYSGTSTFSVGAGTNPPAQVTPTPVTNITLLDILPVSPAAVPDSAVITVTGVGITTPVVVRAPYVGGIAHFSVPLPVGTQRVAQVDQYKGGLLVLSGTSTFNVGPGTNALQVMTPTTSNSALALNVVVPGPPLSAGAVPDSAVLTVTGFGIATPLRTSALFNASGVASTSINMPVGVNRQLQVDMYLSGQLVFSGTSNINVLNGTNPTQQVTPTPITGNVPIQVTVGSFVVSVAPTAATVNVGQTATLTATVRDALGNLVTGVSAIWATANPAIASVNPTTGVVTAVHTGVTTITATVLGAAANATVTVP